MDQERGSHIMSDFIEKNRKLLSFYCVGAQIIGWVLLLLGGASIVLALVAPPKVAAPQIQQSLTMIVSYLFFKVAPAGLVALGVSQFVRHMFDKEHKAGWLLRHGAIILYAYAVLLICSAVWEHSRIVCSSWIAYSDLQWWMFIITPQVMGLNPALRDWMLYVLPPSAVLTAAKVLILIGLGQVLRRVMPVIEESKTLV